MAQTWVPTWRKRLMLATLDVIARVLPSKRSRGSASRQAPLDVRRILVVELWNIGDVVLAMPFLAQLRRLFPAARIFLLGRPHARTVLEGTGLVDEVIETDLGWTEEATRFNPFGYRWLELRRVRAELSNRDLDIAFSARMHIREHLILALSGSRRRVGFAFGTGGRVLTDPIPIGDPDWHKVLDWLKLLEPFGAATSMVSPRLKVSAAERDWATEYLRAHGVAPGDRIVGIHPGASVTAKRWPLDRFKAVAHSLCMRPDVKVLAFVDPAGYGSPIGEGDDVITTKVGLREMIALIERCDLLVCNDSGPMHIAGALGVPTVAIFGSGIASWFAPLGDGHRLVSGEGDDRDSRARPEGQVERYDVRAVRVERVLEAVDTALAEAISRG